jgi:hypothetical protein
MNYFFMSHVAFTNNENRIGIYRPETCVCLISWDNITTDFYGHL